MWKMNEFMISTDKSLLDFETIYQFISSESYWGIGRSTEVMEKAISNSAFCFGVYEENHSNKKQIGFARIVTDLATFGYLSDVFILEQYRKKGLGKWLLDTIVNHPDLRTLKRLTLFTRTPNFYLNSGFEQYDQSNISKFMELKLPR